MRKEKIIWQNIDVDPDYEFYKEEYPDIYEKGEEAVLSAAEDDNLLFLEDERKNLDIQLSNPILILGDVERWNGRVQGYKVIESGNIKDILYSECDSIKWYSDGYNIKGIGYHHDGTNYMEYREIKDNINIENFLNKIYNGEKISRRSLNYYTKSILPEVAKVYGW